MLHRQLRRACAALLAVVLGSALAAALADSRYLYDDLGRLILAVDSDGSAVVYEHDANGNMTAAHRWASAAPIVASFSPTSGRVGTQLTIQGAGFSAEPGENLVTIGGAAAVVDSASSSELVVTVPTAAVTGAVAVTVDGTVGISTQSYVVLRPTITGFSPSLVNPGNAVTLTGTSLNLAPGSTSIAVGSATATVTSLTNVQAVFTTPNTGSNAITVNTSYGQATSTGVLTVIPSSVNVANVVTQQAIVPGGAAASISINQQNKFGLFELDAAVDQLLTLQVSTLTTTPSGASVAYQVISPTGAVITSGSINASNRSIHLPKIATAGRHVVSLASGGSTSAQITATLEVNPTLNALGTPTAASTPVSGQSRRFVIDGAIGDKLALAITNLTVPTGPNGVTVRVYRPSGALLTQYSCYPNTGCSGSLGSLPDAGKYTVTVSTVELSTMTFSLTLSQDVQGTLTTGTPFALNLTVPGQQGRLTFATAGGTYALHMGSLSTTPANRTGYIYVYGPTGAQIANSSTTTQTTLNLTNLAAGTYTVTLSLSSAATGSMQITLAAGLTSTLPTNGTSQSFSSTVPGQMGYHTFTATAGDNLGLGFTGLSAPTAPNGFTVRIYRPNGSQLQLFGCYASNVPGCSATLRNLPETGTYRITVETAPSEPSMIGYTLTLSPMVTGTLTLGTPLTVSFASPGQQALLTFTATAGQVAALGVGSIATSPARSVWLYVYNPSGTQVASAGSLTQATLNLPNLVAGTYTVLAIPTQATTGSAQISLMPGMSGPLPANGTSQTFSSALPSQIGYFSFAATAGDDLALAITGISFSPAMGNGVVMRIYRPGGAQLQAATLYSSMTAGYSTGLLNLPDTGTYTVTFEPSAASTMTFTLTLSQMVTATLTPGTPLTVTITLSAQRWLLSFAATAGQSRVLNLASISTTPAGKTVYAYVFNPSGTQIASTSGTSSANLNLPNLVTGTYSILITPQDAASASLQVTLQ